MIALIRALRRIDRLTAAEFQAHWLQRARHRIFAAPGVKRSVQYHLLPAETDHTVGEGSLGEMASPIEDYDGVSAEWFDDDASLQAFLSSAYLQDELAQEDWFIDHARSFARVVDPHVIFEPDDVDLVLLQLIKRRPDLDREEFGRIWLEHAPLGFMTRDRGFLKGYLQLHWRESWTDSGQLAPLGSEAAGWDGVVLSYMESVAAIKAMSVDPILEESAKHAADFLDGDGWLALTTRREVIKEVTR